MYISQRNTLLVHQLHIVLHGIRQLRHRHPQAVEVLHAALGVVVVDHVAVQDQQDLVELQEDLGGGLVDGGHHRPARLGQPVEELDQVKSSRRVESGGGLIEEDERGVDEQFDSDGSPLLLST